MSILELFAWTMGFCLSPLLFTPFTTEWRDWRRSRKVKVALDSLARDAERLAKQEAKAKAKARRRAPQNVRRAPDGRFVSVRTTTVNDPTVLDEFLANFDEASRDMDATFREMDRTTNTMLQQMNEQMARNFAQANIQVVRVPPRPRRVQQQATSEPSPEKKAEAASKVEPEPVSLFEHLQKEDDSF